MKPEHKKFLYEKTVKDYCDLVIENKTNDYIDARIALYFKVIFYIFVFFFVFYQFGTGLQINFNL